jgi:hypothetical protein
MALSDTVAKPVAAVADAARRFDPLRPFRYAKGFIGGTFDSTFNGMGNWGRKGSFVGAGIGTLVALAGAAPVTMPVLMVIACGWAAGLVTGAVAGGSVGLLTGGIQGVNRERRSTKYSEDMVSKARAASHPGPRVDYRAAHQAHKARETYNFDRLQQQERENERDTYYQDMVNESRTGQHYKGF